MVYSKGHFFLDHRRNIFPALLQFYSIHSRTSPPGAVLRGYVWIFLDDKKQRRSYCFFTIDGEYVTEQTFIHAAGVGGSRAWKSHVR